MNNAIAFLFMIIAYQVHAMEPAEPAPLSEENLFQQVFEQVLQAKAPPPHQDVEPESLTLEQKQEIDQYWNEVNDEVINILDQSEEDGEPLDALSSETIRQQVKFLVERQKAFDHANPEQQRLLRQRNAVEQMFSAHIATAEYYSENTNPNNKKAWDKLNVLLWENTSQNLDFQVHYINLDDPAFKDIDPVKNKQEYTFKYTDNPRIISVVFLKPKQSISPPPLGIFNHGGGNKNWFYPGQINPMLAAFVNLGYALAIPNYRGETAENHAEDMAAVVHYLSKHKLIDPTRVVLSGISSGSTLNAQILDHPIINKFAGVFLHTGLYDSPKIFDHILNIPKDLPLFIASGERDTLTSKLATLRYIHALKNISKNLTSYVLPHGDHQLITPLNPDGKALPLDENRINDSSYVKEIMQQASQAYNASEVMNYISHLVSFLDGIAHGHVKEKVDYAPIYPSPKEIVKKAETIRELKGRTSKVAPDQLGKSIFLAQAPYTFFEMHLKVLLGNDYMENNLEESIKRFLVKYDQEKSDILAEFAKKYNEEPQKTQILEEDFSTRTDIIELIKMIAQKEQDYKGAYVIYHGTDASTGFVYDLYSAIRNLLTLRPRSEGNLLETTRLRLLDEAFANVIHVDDFIEQMRSQQHKDTSSFNYLPGYPERGISGQWFLFGSYKYWFNSTFFRYFLLSKKSGTTTLHTLLSTFLKGMGFDSPNELSRSLQKVYEEYVDPKDGRLIQIFINPDIIDEVAYVSETLGYPLEITFGPNSSLTYKPSLIFENALTDPLTFEHKLKENRSKFQHQDEKDREEFQKNGPNLRYINSLEARFLMLPKYMDDPHKIQMLSYHRIPPVKDYHKKIQGMAQKIVEQWLNLDLAPTILTQKEKAPLTKLTEYIQKGTHESPKAPAEPQNLYDILSTGQFDRAVNWLNLYPHDINKPIDLQGRPTLYHLLSDGKFKAAQWLINNDAHVDALDNQRYPILYDLLDAEKYDAAQFLIENGANLHSVTKDSNPMIIDFVKRGKFNQAKFLLNQAITKQISPEVTENLAQDLQDKILIEMVKKGKWSHAAKRAQELLGYSPEDIQARNQELKTILLNKPEAQDFAKAKELILHGADLNQSEGSDTNLLSQVIQTANPVATEWMIWQGATVTSKHLEEIISVFEDPYAETLVKLCLSLGVSPQISIYMTLVDADKLQLAQIVRDFKPQDAETYLFKLLDDTLPKPRWDAEDKKRLLGAIALGANFNTLNFRGLPITFYLAQEERFDDLIWLCEHGADINRRGGNNGTTPLLNWLIDTNKMDINTLIPQLERLVQAGLDLDLLDQDGDTLYFTLIYGHPFSEQIQSLMTLLAKLGANTSVSGFEPILYRYLIMDKFSTDPEAQTKAQWLIEHGANINQATRSGQKIMSALLRNERVEAFKFLVEQPSIPSIDLTNTHLSFQNILENAITSAIQSDNWQTVDTLLVKGGDPNILVPYKRNYDISSGNIIHYLIHSISSANYLTKVIDHFLALGVNLDNLNSLQFSPLSTLIDSNDHRPDFYDQVGRFLIQKGADINKIVARNKVPLLYLYLAQYLVSDFKNRIIWMIENGADINAILPCSGQSIFEALVKNNLFQGRDLLLERYSSRIRVTPTMEPITKEMLFNRFIVTQQWDRLQEFKMHPEGPIPFLEKSLKYILDQYIDEGQLEDSILNLLELGASLHERIYNQSFPEVLLKTHPIIHKNLFSQFLKKGLNTLDPAYMELVLEDETLVEQMKSYFKATNKDFYGVIFLNLMRVLSTVENASVSANRYLISTLQQSPAYQEVYLPLLTKHLIQMGKTGLDILEWKDALALSLEGQSKEVFISTFFLNILAKNKVSILQTTTSIPNISPELMNLLLVGKNQEAKEHVDRLASKRTATNGELWNILTSNDNDWKMKATTILQSNPHRDVTEEQTTFEGKKYSDRLLHVLMDKDKWNQAQWLIDQGANVEATTGEDSHPLLLYVLLKWRDDTYQKGVQFLVKNGARINGTFNDRGDQEKILYGLISRSEYDRTAWLITQGADVNDQEGAPAPLLSVLQKYKDEFVKKDVDFLVNHGANINLIDHQTGVSLVSTLLKAGKKDRAQILIDLGAEVTPEDVILLKGK